MQKNYDLIKQALEEDLGEGDHTSRATIAPKAMGRAVLVAKQKGILAGIEIAGKVFSIVDEGVQLDTSVETSQDCNFEISTTSSSTPGTDGGIDIVPEDEQGGTTSTENTPKPAPKPAPKPEEKSFIQKYWWVSILILVLLMMMVMGIVVVL